KLHEIAKQGVVDVVSRFLLLHDGATLDVALLPNLSLSPSSEWHERAGADDAAQQGPSVHCGTYQSDPAVLPFLFHDPLLNCFAESATLRAKSRLARCVLIKAEADRIVDLSEALSFARLSVNATHVGGTGVRPLGF